VSFLDGPQRAERSTLTEVAVVLIEPVLAGWGEDVEVDGVFEGLGGVGEVAGDDEDLAGSDDVRGAVAHDEAERSLEDEGELLVGVGVGWDDAALGEDDAGEHRLSAGNELAAEERVELFVFDVFPAINSCGGHSESLSEK
jgi:hypothetical protein